jgi:hypothetical protein
MTSICQVHTLYKPKFAKLNVGFDLYRIYTMYYTTTRWLACKEISWGSCHSPKPVSESNAIKVLCREGDINSAWSSNPVNISRQETSSMEGNQRLFRCVNLIIH